MARGGHRRAHLGGWGEDVELPLGLGVEQKCQVPHALLLVAAACSDALSDLRLLPGERLCLGPRRLGLLRGLGRHVASAQLCVGRLFSLLPLGRFQSGQPLLQRGVFALRCSPLGHQSRLGLPFGCQCRLLIRARPRRRLGRRQSLPQRGVFALRQVTLLLM